MSGRKVAVGVAILAILGVVAFLLLRDGGGIPGLKKEPPPATAAIKAAQVTAADHAERPEAGQRATENSTKVLDALNRMYTLALLRPARWPSAEGQPAPLDELAGFFADEAKPSVTPNAGALALMDLGPAFKRVDPTRQEATRISFVTDEDLSQPFAIATVVFEANGTTEKKADGPVKIVHNATYWLVADPAGYKIVAYTVELRADTEVKKAAFGEIGR